MHIFNIFGFYFFNELCKTFYRLLLQRNILKMH